MSKFDDLLNELGSLNKSLPDPENEDESDGTTDPDNEDTLDLSEAVSENNEDDGDTESTSKKKKKGEGEEDEDDLDEGTLGKSLTLQLESGEEIEAVDGTELVKSLVQRLNNTETQLNKAMTLTISTLTKLSKKLGTQDDLVKSLGKSVEELGDQGRGRKSVIQINEKPSGELNKSDGDTMTAHAFMAKALTAQQAGKITGHDVSLAESYINRGMQIPEALVSKVLN